MWKEDKQLIIPFMFLNERKIYLRLIWSQH